MKFTVVCRREGPRVRPIRLPSGAATEAARWTRLAAAVLLEAVARPAAAPIARPGGLDTRARLPAAGRRSAAAQQQAAVRQPAAARPRATVLARQGPRGTRDAPTAARRRAARPAADSAARRGRRPRSGECRPRPDLQP